MRIELFHSILKAPYPSSTQMYRHLKPGLREHLLRVHMPHRMRAGIGLEIEARLSEADRICEVFGKRHVQAHRAEKQGRIQDAIRLYEQNVAEGDLSTLSYERLRVLYMESQRRSDAMRVCESYIRTLDELAGFEPSLPSWAEYNRKRFQEHMAELRRH